MVMKIKTIYKDLLEILQVLELDGTVLIQWLKRCSNSQLPEQVYCSLAFITSICPGLSSEGHDQATLLDYFLISRLQTIIVNSVSRDPESKLPSFLSLLTT